MNRHEFLKLPIEERRKILSAQVDGLLGGDCDLCHKPLKDSRPHVTEGYIIMPDGRIVHHDCASDYTIRQSREDKQCE